MHQEEDSQQLLSLPLTSSPHKRSDIESSTGNKKSTGKTTKLRKQTKSVNKSKKSSTNVQNDSQTYACLVCAETFDDDWIQCNLCKGWAHEACANITNAKYYYCESCL